MSAYSTRYMTRSEATRLLMLGLVSPSDEVLGNMLDALLKDKCLYNFIVVSANDERADATSEEFSSYLPR